LSICPSAWAGAGVRTRAAAVCLSVCLSVWGSGAAQSAGGSSHCLAGGLLVERGDRARAGDSFASGRAGGEAVRGEWRGVGMMTASAEAGEPASQQHAPRPEHAVTQREQEAKQKEGGGASGDLSKGKQGTDQHRNSQTGERQAEASSQGSPPMSPASVAATITSGQGDSVGAGEQAKGGQIKEDLYKTELCKKWMTTGACRYAGKCRFAHGYEDMRTLVRHPLYKTSMCKSFQASGHCRYGSRCRFIHDETEEYLSQLPRGIASLNLGGSAGSTDNSFPRVPSAPANLNTHLQSPLLQQSFASLTGEKSNMASQAQLNYADLQSHSSEVHPGQHGGAHAEFLSRQHTSAATSMRPGHSPSETNLASFGAATTHEIRSGTRGHGHHEPKGLVPSASDGSFLRYHQGYQEQGGFSQESSQAHAHFQQHEQQQQRQRQPQQYRRQTNASQRFEEFSSALPQRNGLPGGKYTSASALDLPSMAQDIFGDYDQPSPGRFASTSSPQDSQQFAAFGQAQLAHPPTASSASWDQDSGSFTSFAPQLDARQIPVEAGKLGTISSPNSPSTNREHRTGGFLATRSAMTSSASAVALGSAEQQYTSRPSSGFQGLPSFEDMSRLHLPPSVATHSGSEFGAASSLNRSVSQPTFFHGSYQGPGQPSQQQQQQQPYEQGRHYRIQEDQVEYHARQLDVEGSPQSSSSPFSHAMPAFKATSPTEPFSPTSWAVSEQNHRSGQHRSDAMRKASSVNELSSASYLPSAPPPLSPRHQQVVFGLHGYEESSEEGDETGLFY